MLLNFWNYNKTEITPYISNKNVSIIKDSVVFSRYSNISNVENCISIKDRNIKFINGNVLYIFDLNSGKTDSLVLLKNKYKFINNDLYYKVKNEYIKYTNKNVFNDKPSLKSEILKELLDGRSYINTYSYDSLPLPNGYHKVFGKKTNKFYNWFVNIDDSICYQVLDNVILAFSPETLEIIPNFSFIVPELYSLTSNVIFCDGNKKTIIFENSFGSLLYFDGKNIKKIYKNEGQGIGESLTHKFFVFERFIYHIHIKSKKITISKIGVTTP